MFDEILAQQIQIKDTYIKTRAPGPECISIQIKKNRIIDVINGHGFIHPSRKIQYITLLTNVLAYTNINDCIININLSDHPRNGYFNFTRKRGSKTFLLPNHRFTCDDIKIDDTPNTTSTFQEEIQLIRSKLGNISTKRNKIYTSSLPHTSKIDYFHFCLQNPFCDGYMWLGSVHKNCNASQKLVDDMKQKNMAGDPFMPFIKHAEYKYVLYNDGNTLSDRMRLLLCLDSVIIRKNSLYEEFYTYLLKHNTNYIEYNNVEELPNIYEYLETNPDVCATIIENNKNFIDTVLTYKNILQYTADLINSIC